MVNGTAMNMASRSIDLISKKSKKKQIARAAHSFFLISKNEQICTCSTLFVFVCSCFAQLQRCFVGLKRQTSQLHIIFVCVSCSLLFFTAAHFYLAGRQHFSLSHSRFEFSCFSSYKIRLFCFQSLALALSLK